MRTERGLTRERELQSGREVRCQSEMTEAGDQVSRGRSSGARIDEDTAWFDTRARARSQGEMMRAGDEGDGGRRSGGDKACDAAGRAPGAERACSFPPKARFPNLDDRPPLINR